MKQKGFTLIELLVVIAIIGILSGVVLASVNSARNKAKDAAIRTSMREYEKLFNLEFSNTGKYQLQAPAFPTVETDCDDTVYFAINGTTVNVATARAICKVIVKNSSGGNRFMSYNSISETNRFSIMAKLSNGRYLCIGNSGTSETNDGDWFSVGCVYNP